MTRSGGVGRTRRRLSIENRIAAAALATAVAVLLAAACVFFVGQYRSEMDAAASARLAAGRAAASTARPEPASAARALAALAQAPQLDRAYLLDGRGAVVARTVYGRPARAADAAPPRASATQRVALPRWDGRPAGTLVMVAGRSRGSTALSQAFAVCSALFFAATGLALVLGRAFARRILEPLERLSVMMREGAATGALDRRAGESVDAPLEVARLTESFDALLDRLQARDAELNTTLHALTHARDAAEAANVMKSQFLANMSHEIRTPLNGVLAMTQVMALGDLAPDQRERLRVVRDSGESLLAVLNDVLDVSKIEAGKLELELAPFDFVATVKAACDGFAGLAAQKGLALEVKVAPEVRGLRLGDEGRLRQVACNLVSNALKFTSQGGVTVELEGAGAAGAEGVVLRVRDTGLGFAEARLPQLMEAFAQADSTTTRRFGGTGLGLTICRELLALMGGTIAATSRPGEGATFEARAPLPAVAAAGADPAPGLGLQASRGDAAPAVRVLAAEDNPTNRQVLATVMGVFGMGLHMVEDGREAVEAWSAGAYDLILMDVQMPVMDGVEATRAIRAAERAQGRPRTPIVALSANAMPHQVRDYLAAGMDAHVAKPIDLARLQAVMVAVLERTDAEAA